MITQFLLWIVGSAFVATFVIRAWGPGRWGPKNRPQLVRAGMDAVVALAAVRALVPPPGWGSWLWVGAAAAVGIGLAGVILRWQTWAPGPNRRSVPWWPTVVYGAVAAILVVALA